MSRPRAAFTTLACPCAPEDVVRTIRKCRTSVIASIFPADAPRAPIVGTSQSGDQAAWIGQAGVMDGDMDMTRVNSAVRNPVSLDANARNRAKRGIEPRPSTQLRARSSPDHA